MSKSLTELFVDQLKLCKLKPTETVGVISELGKKTEYVQAAVAAARSLGAGAIVLTASELSHSALPPVKANSREVSPLLAGAAECDLIVDVTVGGLIHSDVRTRITDRGKRMLFVAEPPEILDRLMGSEEIRNRVKHAGSKLKAGKLLHVKSEAGTDLSADIWPTTFPSRTSGAMSTSRGVGTTGRAASSRAFRETAAPKVRSCCSRATCCFPERTTSATASGLR